MAGNVWNNDISAPQTSLFEWVTYKQFFLAPEITIYNTSCLAITATMDVATEATNVSWQLTPSSLFTTLSGTGKVANIVKASGAQGLGKITYTFQMPGGESFTAEKDIWVGDPLTPANINGFTYNGMNFGQNSTYEFSFDPASVQNVNNYEWVVGGGTIISGQGTNSITVLTGNNQGMTTYFDVSIRVENSCGWSSYLWRSGFIDTGIGPAYIIISPNPSSGETTLELASNKEEALTEEAEWELEVYDSMQSLKEKKIKIKGKQTKLNTSAWKDGVYIVRVRIGDEMISEKLMVKH